MRMGTTNATVNVGQELKREISEKEMMDLFVNGTRLTNISEMEAAEELSVTHS